MNVYVVRYGTCTTLVEARSPTEAELRVRTGMTDPRWTTEEITAIAQGEQLPARWTLGPVLPNRELKRGDVFVREARPADVEDWLECGGKLSGVPKALRP